MSRRYVVVVGLLLALAAGCGSEESTVSTDGTSDSTDGTSDSTDRTSDSTDGTSDWTDGTSDWTDGTSDSTDGTSDSTDGLDGVDGGDGVDGLDGTGDGYVIVSPEWLRGVWVGGGKVAIVDSDNISFGDIVDGRQVDITPFNTFGLLDPGATFTVHTNDESTFAYTIAFIGPEGPVSFTDTFDVIDADTVEYTFEMGGAVVANLQMSRTAASTFVRPPAWLQGSWQGVATDRTPKATEISATNILFGDVVEGTPEYTDFGGLLDMDPSSTYRVVSDDDTQYAYVMAFNTPGGLISFQDTFERMDDGSVVYTFVLAGELVDSFPLTNASQ